MAILETPGTWRRSLSLQDLAADQLSNGAIRQSGVFGIHKPRNDVLPSIGR